jgi:hypothetical protein
VRKLAYRLRTGVRRERMVSREHVQVDTEGMKILFGALVGVLAAWVYSSERARELARQRLAAAPERLQHVQRLAASAAADSAQRASEALDAAPLPDQVKGAASEVAFNAWAVADQLGHASQAAPSGNPEQA